MTVAALSPYMLVDAVAARYHCSARTIRERARLGEIPHRRPSGTRRLLFLAVELDAYDDGAELEVVELPRGGRIVRPRSQT